MIQKCILHMYVSVSIWGMMPVYVICVIVGVSATGNEVKMRNLLASVSVLICGIDPEYVIHL